MLNSLSKISRRQHRTLIDGQSTNNDVFNIHSPLIKKTPRNKIVRSVRSELQTSKAPRIGGEPNRPCLVHRVPWIGGVPPNPRFTARSADVSLLCGRTPPPPHRPITVNLLRGCASVHTHTHGAVRLGSTSAVG